MINTYLTNKLMHYNIFKKHNARFNYKSILFTIKINVENDKNEKFFFFL